MELNNTCLNLLRHLYAQQEYITIADLAEQTGKTERSVRYSLKLIDEFLHRKKLPYLSREYARGIRLEHTPAMDALLQTFLSSATPYQYKFSTEERELVIKIILLVARSPYTPIAELAERLTVSYGTINTDLINIERWLAQRSLTLIRKSRMGLQIAGEESQIMRCGLQLLEQTVSLAEYDRYLCQKPLDNKITLLILSELFCDLDVAFFRDLPKKAEGVLNCMFSDESFENLMFYLALLTQRHISGAAKPSVKSNHDLPDVSLEGSDEHRAAEMLLIDMAEKYHIKFAKRVHYSLTRQLLCSKSISNTHGHLGRDPERTRRFDGVVDQIVSRMEELYHVDFGAARAELLVRLKTHLTPTVYRIRYHKEIINPVYDELQMAYGQLLQNVTDAIKPLEEYCGAPVNEQEVSYIALYFLAAINQQHPQIINRPQVVVACGSGYGTAQVVASQLKRLFDVDIVDVLAGRDVPDLITQRRIHCDYIISTVDLPRLPDGSYIRVNPIFTRKDCQNIFQFMDAHNHGYSADNRWSRLSTLGGSDSLYFHEYLEEADKMVEIAKKYGANVESEHIRYEFLSLLMQPMQSQESADHMPVGPGLQQLLRPHLIQMDVSCTDWRSVVTASTALMEKYDFVSPDYKNAIIQNILDFGPGMVMFPGVLISHAAPENGCHKLGFAYLKLKEPVVFGNADNDPVQAVFTLSAIDQSSHLEALTQIFHLLSEASIREEIIAAGTKEEFLKILRRYLC